MALTQEQIEIMDRLSGMSNNPTTPKTSESKDMFSEMDKITGLGTQTQNENLSLDEQIKNDNPEQYQQWKDKGPIKPYEAALNASKEFNGTYENVIQKEQRNPSEMNALGKAVTSFFDKVTPNTVKNTLKKIDNKLNNVFDSDAVMKEIDRQYALNEYKQGVNRDDKTKRYEITGFNAAGLPIYKEVDLLKKIGFLEAMSDGLPKGTAIGALSEGFDTKKEREIKDRILKGEPIRQDELDYLNRRIDREKEKQVRGYSIGGNIGNAVGYSLGFTGDLLAGSALFKALGLGAIGTGVAETVSNLNKESKAVKIAGDVAGWTTNRLGETALTTLINSPHRLFEGYQERMLNNEMKLTDNGNAVFSISEEKPATALFKSLGSIYIANLTEIAGGEFLSTSAKIIGKGASAAVTPLTKNLFAKYPVLEKVIKDTSTEFAKRYEQINGMPVLAKSMNWMKSQAHFDGFLEEMGEEVLEDVLNLTVGTNYEERSLENYAKAIFKTPEEWAVIAGAIAIQGAGLSMAGATVGNVMAKNGKTPDEIQEVLETSTENQARDILDDYINNGTMNIDKDSEIRLQETKESLAQKHIDDGLDSKDAEFAAEIESAMFKTISEKTNKDIDEVIEQYAPRIVNKMDEQTYVDDEGVLHTGITNVEESNVENTQEETKKPETITERITRILDEYDNMPDNLAEEEYTAKLNEYAILDKIASNEEYSLEDIEEINNYIADLEENGETEFAATLKDILDNPENKPQYFQSVELAGSEDNADYSDAIKEWKEKGTESKYFKEWFGDSKVVDENGKPMIVYHGGAKFDTFDYDKIGTKGTSEGVGFYFTSDKETAKGYTNKEGELKEVYLSIKKPLGYDSHLLTLDDMISIVKRTAELEAEEYEEELRDTYLSNYVDTYSMDIDDAVEQVAYMIYSTEKPDIDMLGELAYGQNSEFVNRATVETTGYDGIITNGFANEGKGGGNIYIAFTPEQIKSVNNKGTFDANNSNIYFQSEIDYKNIENNFSMTSDEMTSMLQDDIKNILAENDIDESEFNFEDIKIYGSYATGKNKANSDLDVVVQYSGTMREDAAFNILNDEKIFLYDNNNNKISVDINPINTAESGTIEDYLKYLQKIDDRPNKNVYYQSAYHGSPHKFDEFSLDAIGTGEGNQAHGWGLYFAENKDTSENYRKVLTERFVANSTRSLDESLNDVLIDGKPLLDNYDLDVDKAVLNVLQGKDKNSIINKLNYKIKDWNDFAKDPTYPFKDYAKKKSEEYTKLKTDIENGASIKFGSEGQLFEVEIPEIDEMLDEDKKINKQSSQVKKAIKAIEKEYGVKYHRELDIGKQVYANLISILGSPKDASLKLNEYGIKGITYNGREDGRCYVVFDDKAIDVIKTYYQDGEQQNLIVNNAQRKQVARKMKLVKGAYTPDANFITLFKGADHTTIEHELAHLYLEILTNESKNNEEIKDDLDAVRKFVGNNGENFTKEQHEKFARGFEAYIRTGSARTNKLKKLFEDLKNFILSICESTKNTIEDLGFTEDDIQGINELYNRLLSTENERIKEAVFNKCNELDEQIAAIRRNQEKEFAEIEEIEKNNIEKNVRSARKNEQVKEYLRLAQNQIYKEPKEVKELRQRYKNATLDILAAVSGQSRQWVANPRNWNKLETIVGNAADEITTSTGFDASWGEFYSNTGVTYDNDEIDGDYKLAQQALDVLQEGTFNFNGFIDKYDVQEFSDFYKMFDYLVAKVKTTRGENKDAAMEALNSLFKKIPSMPDEMTQEIVRKMNDIAETYIDDKINEKTKKAIPNVSLPVQFKTYVTQKLYNMKAYDPDSKRYIRLTEVNKLYKLLQHAQDVFTTKEVIRQINQHAINQLENRQKGILSKEIQKQIKINSKVIRQGAIQKGKFDWKTNTVFSKLVGLNKKSREEAQIEYDAYINADKLIEAETRDDINSDNVVSLKKSNNSQDRLYMSFLEYKKEKLQDLNLANTRYLLEQILALKYEGRRAKNEEEFNKAFESENLKVDLAGIIQRKLKNNEWAKRIAKFSMGEYKITSESTLANWENILTVLFDKQTARDFSLLNYESQAEIYANEKMREMIDCFNKVYKFEKRSNDGIINKIKNAYDKAVDYNLAQNIVKMFQEYDKELFTVSARTWNKNTNEVMTTNEDLSRSEIMMFYGWSLNEQLRERLENTYGQYQLDYMFSQLSEKDKEMMYELSLFCDTMYDSMNQVNIRRTGLSLPKVENYLPSKTERYGSDLDMLGERLVKASNFSATKLRKTCSRIKQKAATPLEILIPHINKSARYIILSERLDYLNKVFCDNPHLTKALQDAYSINYVTTDSPLHYDYVHNQTTGEKVDIIMNDEINPSKIRAVKINIDPFFVVSKKPSENKKNIISQLDLKENPHYVQNENTKDNVMLNASTIAKSLSNVKRKDATYEDVINILLNIENLFKTSEKILSHNDIKTDTDMIVDRYANIVDLEGKEYLLQFVVKNKEGVDLYSVEAIDSKKVVTPNASSDLLTAAPATTTNSIEHIKDVFKSNLVEKYNKDYIQNIARIKSEQNKKKTLLEKIFGKKKNDVGAKLAQKLRNQLGASTYENYARNYQTSSNILDWLANGYITASIGGNMKVMITQLVSVINYTENMPIDKWHKGMAEALKHPKQTWKFMMDNCPYLSARIAGNSQNEVVANLAKDAGMFKNLKQFLMSNTKYGDILAIIFGGKPYVDYLMKKGMSKDEAFKQFVEDTLRSQQSGHHSATSAWQKDQSRNGIAKLVLGAFNNTNLQYERKWIEALSNYSKGDISGKELAKTFVLYKALNPILFTSVLTNLSLLQFTTAIIGGGDPDELAKELGIDLGLAVILSNVKGYGFAGVVALALSRMITAAAMHKKTFDERLPILSDIEDITRKLIKGTQGELSFADWIKTSAKLLDFSGIPAERMYNEGEGIYDITQGEYLKGLLKMQGYSDSKAKTISGEEE